MPVDTTKANDVWVRYQYLRDNGHQDYVRKAYKCEDFFAGLQWDKNDLALLKAQRRPALTINKIISTLANVMGEQIFNRTEAVFRPRNEAANQDLASVLTKVYMQISDNNQLPWIRSDVFADGIITSRGFFDVRLDFGDSLRGEVKITQLNPKNVLVDLDADSYDPDDWHDVIVTKWMSVDEIELLYSKKDADILRHSQGSNYALYGYDLADMLRDRFGTPTMPVYGMATEAGRTLTRNIRVIERQWRKLDKMAHFVDIMTGDTRPVPDSWSEEQVSQHLLANPTLSITKKLVHRIRWTVVADNVVLHDDWSPYKHFTVIPFFPYFRRGRTIGLVENLLGPQELLNKVRSQELHIVNTTANSGWKVKTGSLTNMSTGELEQRGATTGLVLELDDINNAEKIQPNTVPTGLDRISFKSEEDIKNISGVTDYQTGNAREDVSAKAVKLNQSRGSANFAKVMDNMNRTDYLMAVRILDIVQEYYTEPRILNIVTDKLTQATEQLRVNSVDQQGIINNDLTIGEYQVVITSQPERDTFEDSQFEQAVMLRNEVGVAIPDKYIILASRMKDKAAMVQEMESAAQTPEAQEAAQLKMRAQRAEVAKIEGEAVSKQTDAELKRAKAQKELAQAQNEAGGDQAALQKIEAEFALEERKLEMEMQMAREKMEAELQMAREKMQAEIQIKREAAQAQAVLAKATAVHKMNQAEQQAASKPADNDAPA